MLSLQFTILTLVLGGCAVACAVVFLALLMPRLRRVRRAIAAEEDTEDVHFPSASILVIADGDGRNLATLLPQLLAQDYPAPFEVVVVQTDDTPTATDLVSRLQAKHSNLYMTYVPEGSRNLSRRKLAITLGAKAAQNEVLVLTRGNARVNSAEWLRRICRHFALGRDLVLGYAYPAVADDEGTLSLIRGKGSRRESFEATRQAIEWLNPALAGAMPLRGDGANLAYRRSAFFENNGFSSSLNLVNGDDDVFIAEIARPGRTGVELSPESMVAEVLGSDPADELRGNRASRLATRQRLRRGPRAAMAAVTWMSWLGTLTALGCALSALPSLIPAAAMLLLGLIAWLPPMLSWTRTAKKLGLRGARLTLPWWIMTRPLRSIGLQRLRRRQRRDFTWQTL